MIEISDLEQLGLPKNEAKTYSSLLELGSSKAAEIIKKTGFHRNIVYDNLSHLIKKGLVGNIKKGKKTYFQAMPPHSLLELTEMKAKKIEEEKVIAQKLIKEIMLLQTLTKKKEEAIVYQGYKGVTAVLEQLLKEKHDIYAFGASAELVEGIQMFYKYFFPRWHKQRQQNKITLSIIYSENNRERGEQIRKIQYAKVKFIPKQFSSPISMSCSGDQTIIITFGKEPFAISIRSKEISKGIKSYFDALWNMAKN